METKIILTKTHLNVLNYYGHKLLIERFQGFTLLTESGRSIILHRDRILTPNVRGVDYLL